MLTAAQGKQIAVPGVDQQPLVTARESASRVRLVGGKLGAGPIGQLDTAQIKRAAVDFRLHQQGAAIATPQRRMIAAGIVGHLAVFAAGQVINPDIPGEGVHIALAPLAFIGFFFAIGDAPAVGTPARLAGGVGEQHLRGAAAHGDFVKLRQAGGGKIARSGAVHTRRAEQHTLAIGGEITGPIGGVVKSQTAQIAALGVHDKDIEIPETIRGKGDLRPVARPHRVSVPGAIARQRGGGAALHRHAPQITQRAEQQLRAIGRHRRLAEPVFRRRARGGDTEGQ